MSDLPELHVPRIHGSSFGLDAPSAAAVGRMLRATEPSWQPTRGSAFRCAAPEVESEARRTSECPATKSLSVRDSGEPRLATRFHVWREDDALRVTFVAEDESAARSTYSERDDPLYLEDVVEVFLAPVSLTRYFELEVSPSGIVFDAVIDSPDGHRGTMRADVGWTCEGLEVLVDRARMPERVDRVEWRTALRIPFRALGVHEPGDDMAWRANFFRIDRGREDEFCAWSPTFRVPADFHVPARFGWLR